MEARVLLLLFTLRCLLAAAGAADVTEPPGESGSAAAPEERLHPQRAGEINACLHHVPDVGCDTFACLENTTCHLDDNLYEICTDFLQNADNFDVQGKQFIKDFLKCSAIGIKSRFSSSVTRCAAVQRILVHVQAKCYQQHNICAVANSNIDALANMIDLNKIHLNGAYLEYVRFLFDCDNDITVAIRSHLQSRLGSSLSILRELLQDSCTIMEKTTPASITEGHVLPDDDTTQDNNWK